MRANSENQFLTTEEPTREEIEAQSSKIANAVELVRTTEPVDDPSGYQQAAIIIADALELVTSMASDMVLEKVMGNALGVFGGDLFGQPGGPQSGPFGGTLPGIQIVDGQSLMDILSGMTGHEHDAEGNCVHPENEG